MSEPATMPATMPRRRNRAISTKDADYETLAAKSGLDGLAALCLLRDGVSISEVSSLTGLHSGIVAAIRDRFEVGLQHLDKIRTTYQDLALLLGAEALMSVNPEKIRDMPEEKKIDLAMKLFAKNAAPERNQQPAYVQVLNQYNITPSHSASQRTIEQKTPQPIESSASEVKQLNELDGK